jgi:hypothetical protein
MNELTNNKTTNESSRIFSTTENNNVVKFHIVDKVEEQEMAIDGLCGTIDQLQKENEQLRKIIGEMEMDYVQQKRDFENELWEQRMGDDL